MKNIITIICIVFILGACTKKDDKDIIAEHIDAMIKAVETESRRELLKYFSENAVIQKQLKKRDVGALAFRYFYAHDNIKLFVHFINIEPDFERVNANVSAKVLITSGKELLPERASLYEVSGQWKKQKGDWLISELNWKRLQLDEI